MKITREMFATLSVDELQAVVIMVEDLIEDRQKQRKKELWGNVVAAIKKYEGEIDRIQILLSGHDEHTLHINDLSITGGIIVD